MRRVRVTRDLLRLRGDDTLRGCMEVLAVDERGDGTTGIACHVAGPPDTCYATGKFRLDIVCVADYPFTPPKCLFITPIYHPNIDTHGNICMDVLKHEWSPALGLTTVVLSIIALLCEPNPDDPLNMGAGDQMRRDRASFEATARFWTSRYAGGTARTARTAPTARTARITTVNSTAATSTGNAMARP